MKKKAYLVVLALCAAMAITACGTATDKTEDTKSTTETQNTTETKDSGSADAESTDSSDKEENKTADAGDTRLVTVDDVSKYVTIGEYKGLTLDNTVEVVTDDAVEGRLEQELQNKAEEVTDGSVQNGDVVTINYVGTKDGVAFDGGTANNYELTIGSGTFIDGFEDGIIGMKKGETKDLDLTFPEDYASSDLAGQEVTFKVTLQSFKRAPELTDEWAAKNTDCKTADDYKKEIRKTLESEAKTNARNTLRETAWNTVLSSSEVKEYPQEDLDTAKTEFKTLYENYAKQGDMTLEDFVKAQGISMDDFEEQSNQYAEYKVKQNLIVQGIMDAENMTLEDEKSLSIQDELIKAYDAKDLAALVDQYGQVAVDESIGLLRVEDFILDNATVEEKVAAGDTQGENGDDPSADGSSAEGQVDEELEAAEATDMVPEENSEDSSESVNADSTADTTEQ
ncbi:trigger factor [Blautia sp. CLA-JM-H16]|uniref:peptidylprolyl isomerase n=1 Tax=Blautia aquisgranensis TaxID=3133153 RepID=A0ABV1BHF2_9FIRM